jgi:hypothetical protein
MRLVAAALVTAFALTAASCGGGDEKPRPSTATLKPSPTEVSATMATSGGGLVVFVRGHDLWISSPNGVAVPPTALTSGALDVGYAGFVRVDGRTDIYYVEEANRGTPQQGNPAEFVLSRRAIEGGETAEVLRFRSREIDTFDNLSTAAASPDGRYIAYADEAGLALLDTDSGATTRVTEKHMTGNKESYAYYYPRWSPDGARLLVKKQLWEGSIDVVVDPFASPATLTETGKGGALSDWSPDGQKICMSEGSFVSYGALLVYDVSSSEFTDMTINVPAPTPSSPNSPRINSHGCAWKRDGTLAVGYALPEGDDAGRVAVLDANLEVSGLSDPIAKLRDVVEWLSDESGVLFNQAGSAGIYRPGIGASALPFQADRVLAVIP